MQNTQVRCARPLSHLSVAQPANNMPTIPAISNIATSHPACDMLTPFDWLSSEGPQSSTEKRTIYTKKLAKPRIQISGFLNTCFIRNARCSALFVSFFTSFTSVPSSSGSPTEEGVSRRKATNPIAPANAMAEGTQKHHFHAPTCAAEVITRSMPAASSGETPRLAAMEATASGSPAMFVPSVPMM